MPLYHLTFNEGKQLLWLPVYGSQFVSRVAETVLFGSLGGQSLLPKELGSFIGGFVALPGKASFRFKTVNLTIIY